MGWWMGANVDARWRALQDMELRRVTPEIRDRLHRRRTGADDRNPLIGQAVEFRLLPAAAGVVVVPTRGVEDLALERRQSGNARQLRPVQRTAAHDHETCTDVVAAIGDRKSVG